MAGIFIAGTDTDVGKTIVTAGMLRHLRRRGVDAVSMKPVQTGGVLKDGRWVATDLAFHHRAAEMSPTAVALELMAPYVYQPACSPHLAGRMAGSYADFDVIANNYAALAKEHACVLVEGAGGLYAPIDEEQTMLDLMRRLGLPVVLVARRGLGTINHSLLSIEAMRSRGLEILGVVFNETNGEERDFIRRDNPGTVAAFSGVPVLGDIDHLGELDNGSDAAWSKFDGCTGELWKVLDAVLNPS